MNQSSLIKRYLAPAAAGLALGMLVGCAPSPDPRQTIRDHYFYGGLAAYQDDQPDEAARQWKRAADLGDGEAARNLGHLYRQGKGVEADGSKAAAWYETAARAGVVSAEYNLGMLYLKGGPGLPPDRDEGLKHLGLAAEQGYEPAKEALRQQGSVMAVPAPPTPFAAAAPPPLPPQQPEPQPLPEVRAQIGSYRTKTAAEKDWRRLRAQGVEHEIIGNRVEGSGHWYRLVAVGPAEAVDALCARAPARGLACWSRHR